MRPQNGAGSGWAEGIAGGLVDAAGCRLRRTGQPVAEGKQGRDAGGTIDADGMRPLHDKRAVKADDPQLARTRPL